MQFDASIHRCAIIVNQDLALGFAMNAASIIGVGIGNKITQLIGNDLMSADNIYYPGVISASLPILKSSPERIKQIQKEIAEHEDIYILPFSLIAQSCKSYDDYTQKLTNTLDQEIQLAAIGLVGNKNSINKLTGNLSLFK
ncbi:DUF2000 domain-containing protein [Providencia stuartii]|uniref:DUF2000 domain-containing protein n=1 Tax=Providencia TaxID=586 RepID=UPI000CE66B3B|nr:MULTISPECIES: DUF2000 domain-containing protein [Providencia]AVE42778.1 DUF2000 domain-containing protein [Providencia stuartii]MBN5556756.1 DUF2000 domain-containing protein [Providencia stuartii]MBQ0457559.1 DUF2000 domain-containing protein [Providencia stuartii]MBQ0693603.1 DUF2000 domain-containing protein [Providencia stuartii]MDN7223226.1 DUF2000 domain-containing protein [Providencia stuartii]